MSQKSINHVTLRGPAISTQSVVIVSSSTKARFSKRIQAVIRKYPLDLVSKSNAHIVILCLCHEFVNEIQGDDYLYYTQLFMNFIIVLLLLIDATFATLTSRNMVYFIVKQIAKCILKKMVWKPVLDAMMENISGRNKEWIALLFLFIVNQIIEHDASNIASFVVVMVTL